LVVCPDLLPFWQSATSFQAPRRRGLSGCSAFAFAFRFADVSASVDMQALPPWISFVSVFSLA